MVRKESRLLTEGLLVLIPDQAVLAAAPLGNVHNPKMPPGHTHCVLPTDPSARSLVCCDWLNAKDKFHCHFFFFLQFLIQSLIQEESLRR